MSSSRRTSSRRLHSPPGELPIGPSIVLRSGNAIIETPPPRPSPHSSDTNMSAGSTNSAASLMDVDRVFDDSPSRSDTPSSPLTPWDASPSTSSCLTFNVAGRSSLGVQGRQQSPYKTSAQLYKSSSEATELTPGQETPSKKSGRKPRCLKEPSHASATGLQRPPLERQPKIDDILQYHKPRIPGTFESQDTDMDVEAEYSGSEPISPPENESAEHTITSIPTMIARPRTTTSLSTVSGSARTMQSLTATKPTGIANYQTKEVKFWAWKSAKKLREINNNIYLCIKNRHAAAANPNEKPAKKPTPGWIYVFESPEKAPAKVKIGKTLKDPQKRKGQWESCGLPLLEVEDSYKNGFNHYSVVESLIKAELHNERRKHKCPHHAPKEWVEHEEWYEIDKEKALKSVHRWRHWITQERPFDDNGQLTPYWHWRVEKLPRFINDVNWDTWTQPSGLDYLDFQLEQFGQGRYTHIKAHLSRKDFHFYSTGGMMIFVLYTQFGIAGVTWGLLALCIL